MFFYMGDFLGSEEMNTNCENTEHAGMIEVPLYFPVPPTHGSLQSREVQRR
jgi:hypothetical protein